ncbi:helix-turn-helix domain-containing protein [Paenibacillus sp. FSL K6-2441]|uniref:AraC family transcriptional regulator n=1 Tax=Paenibacillus sp. FSL K6-2441 TaxID=2954679 RepID=UPI0030DA1C83
MKEVDLTRMSLKDIREYMADHYHEPLSIDDLAQLTGLSPNYFGEAFKNAYQQNVMDYLTDLRIGRVKQLLRETDMCLRDIAKLAGYSDEFYLSKKFKKEVGESPSAYRKNWRKRIAVISVGAMGNLLALGIVPVAAPIDPKWTPYYYIYYQNEIQVHLDCSHLETEAKNIRMLVQAKPDCLFFIEPLSQHMASELRANGVELIPIESRDWKGQLMEMASALGEQKKGESWIADYEQRVDQARKTMGSASRKELTVTLRLCEDQMFLYSNRGIRDVLYQDLALHTIPKQLGLCNEPISREQLQELNPDRLFLLVCPDAATRVHWLTLQHDPSWQRLNAVKKGQLYQIPSNPWFEYSAIAVNRMLEDGVLMLTGKSPISPP